MEVPIPEKIIFILKWGPAPEFIEAKWGIYASVN